MGATSRQPLRFELSMLRPRLKGIQRSLVEFEMLPGRLEGKCGKGLPQTVGDRERHAADAAKLVVFDRSA